jgi:hypothetical protein
MFVSIVFNCIFLCRHDYCLCYVSSAYTSELWGLCVTLMVGEEVNTHNLSVKPLSKMKGPITWSSRTAHLVVWLKLKRISKLLSTAASGLTFDYTEELIYGHRHYFIVFTQ